MNIGERIKARRKELGLSVDEVAKKLNKNRATVYRYESNDIENLPVNILEPLAIALNTTPANLMGWDEEIKNNSQDNNLSKEETILLNNYNKLNDLGKRKLIDYSDDLTTNIRYTNELLNGIAAHNDNADDENQQKLMMEDLEEL